MATLDYLYEQVREISWSMLSVQIRVATYNSNATFILKMS